MARNDNQMETETGALFKAVNGILGVKETAHQIESATLPEMVSVLMELDELLTDDFDPRSYIQSKEAAEISASSSTSWTVNQTMVDTQQEEAYIENPSDYS